MLASVIISTYNRAEALPSTLEALASQDIPASDYEVLVVDDGSTDTTPDILNAASFPYGLRTYRLPANQGVSAGRNVGLRNARGRYVIMISDDLIVPRDFIRSHVDTLVRFPGTWVVGGFTQLDSLAATPFGRFLDELEQAFQSGRLGRRLAEDLFEMEAPTARNLSLPGADLERVGLFDERFRVTCEDQDLAQRAAGNGVRFVYNASIQCIHNDQAADLGRYCRFQQLGARDTARLCNKYPELHGRAPIVRANGYIARTDGVLPAIRKLAKRMLSNSPATRLIEASIRNAEQWRLPDIVLHRAYRLLIGLYTFRGFREGLHEVGGSRSRFARHLRTANTGISSGTRARPNARKINEQWDEHADADDEVLTHTETEHRERYLWAATKVSGRVLDIACGTGYGSRILASAGRVTGVDRDADVVAIAQARVPEGRFITAETPPIPFDDSTFDWIVCFETVEHILDDTVFTSELRRIAAPGGHLLISTPNRAVTSPNQARPPNPFHFREYLLPELQSLLRSAGFAELKYSIRERRHGGPLSTSRALSLRVFHASVGPAAGGIALATDRVR